MPARRNPIDDVHRQLSLLGRDALLERAADPKERRRIEWAAEILGNVGEEVGFLHSGLCMAFMPHRRPEDEMAPWVRSNGRFKLAVIPGNLLKEDGSVAPVGVPWGAKARLIMLYLMTTAVRTNSRCVSMERSMSAWLRKIGLPVTGGPRGTIRPVREQALRISRCSLTLRYDEGAGRASLQDRRMVDGLHLWAADETDEWPEEVELTQEFFEHLREHAVPLDEHAIACLKGSSLALDLYVWLVYRLPRLDKPLVLSWNQLLPQFGSQTKSVDSFAQKLRGALPDVLAVYPGASVEIVTGGLRLRPSPPAVSRTTVAGKGLRLIGRKPAPLG